jgi:hypothetical protein
MKIFVSSTVRDLEDLRDELYRRLKELGHTPWFSEKDGLPSDCHPDAMTNCLKVAEECDLFVVLLDKRAGLPYKKGSPYPDLFGLKISEAEYRCARKKGKPFCIFIRKRAKYESAIYRHINDEGQRKSTPWYSEPEVYEFIDRLMHEKPDIPWIYLFDSIEEIMGPLNTRIREVQANIPILMTPQSVFDSYISKLLKDIKEEVWHPRYTPLKMVPIIFRELGMEKDRNREHEILDVAKKYEKILILGEPGAGKTTSLKRLAEEHAKKKRSFTDLY